MTDSAKIEYDLEANPIEFKVVREAVQDIPLITFRDAKGYSAGALIVYYKEKRLYSRLVECQNSEQPFPSNVPKQNVDIFRITKILHPEIRIKLHCNNVEVFDVIMSENCVVSDWSKFWGSDVASVKFNSDAVEAYRALPGL